MTQGSSSVVVVPQDWEGGIDELARKMMPVTRQPSAQVLPLLERGPMTIEADLSLAEAERLQERLRALGVPARIVAFGEEVGPFQALGSGSKEQKLRAALGRSRSEEHTSELQSRPHLVCRLLLEKKHHHFRFLRFVH